MALSKGIKTRILKAYFERSISKEEMETLLDKGYAIHPMEWGYSDESERIKMEQKRELIRKVFGISIPKIEWV